MTRDQFISIFFIALLIFIVYQIFKIFSPFFHAIFWAAILAFAFFPLYKKLRQAFGSRDILAAVVMTFAIFLIVVPPCVFILYNLTGQGRQLYESASDYVRQGHFDELISSVRSFPIVQKVETQFIQWEIFQQDLGAWILKTAHSIGGFAVTQASLIYKNMFLVIFKALFAFFLLFIFLKDGEKIYEFIYQIAPMEKTTKKSIFSQINETFSAVIRGQLVTAFVQAGLAGTIFWMLGLPIPLFFASVTFLTSMIPILGASAVWLPLVVYLVIQGENVKAVVLFLFGALVISVIDNLLKPFLIGERTKLPYFLLFFGILGGLKVYGLMGIFIAPVVLSLFFALIKIYEEKYL